MLFYKAFSTKNPKNIDFKRQLHIRETIHHEYA